MKLLFVDLETTFQIDDRGKYDPSPYIPDNYLVSAGWTTSRDLEDIKYAFFKHDALYHPLALAASLSRKDDLQEELDDCDLLIAHNAKFDLGWLRAAGFRYTGPIACTQIREYVLARGQKLPLNLNDICEREHLRLKKGALIDEYMKKGIGFEKMPWETVQEYGRRDIECLVDLYHNQLQRIPEHLNATIELMEEFCQILIEIEENGLKIDTVELDRLEAEYTATRNSHLTDLQRIAEEVMGDTPINLNSPEQLSQLIYSRKVKDKHRWAETFNLGSEIRGSVVKPKRKKRYSSRDFVDIVRQQTEIVFKTVANHCEDCDGKGKVKRIKKDGSEFARESSCKNCSGNGYTLSPLTKVAGLRCVPSSYEDTAAGGFSTDKDTLERLRVTATGATREFLEKLLEVNKIEVYLSTFIEGIRRGLRNNSILHPSFMQTVTATGRLSSRNPNFQNQPRGSTFPVRKVVVSRFENGLILEADARQLEFRIAGELSGSEAIFEDVLSNIDVHAATSKHTGFNRQDSKPHTFAPVYGATPNGKPDNIAAYYRYFNDRYRLPEWHDRMATMIIDSGGYYRLPSGKEFYYGEITRYMNGGFTNSTQIANYPVQYMATGELVPMVIIQVAKTLKHWKLQSKLILTVHDSIEIDVYPGELAMVRAILEETFEDLPNLYLNRFNYEINIPIEWEIKVGENWLELKDV